MPKGFLFFESPTATLGICKGQPLWGQVRFLGLFEKSGALMRLGMKDFPNFKWEKKSFKGLAKLSAFLIRISFCFNKKLSYTSTYYCIFKIERHT